MTREGSLTIFASFSVFVFEINKRRSNNEGRDIKIYTKVYRCMKLTNIMSNIQQDFSQHPLKLLPWDSVGSEPLHALDEPSAGARISIAQRPKIIAI